MKKILAYVTLGLIVVACSNDSSITRVLSVIYNYGRPDSIVHVPVTDKIWNRMVEIRDFFDEYGFTDYTADTCEYSPDWIPFHALKIKHLKEYQIDSIYSGRYQYNYKDTFIYGISIDKDENVYPDDLPYLWEVLCDNHLLLYMK